MWKFCLSVSNSRSDAEDLLQETIATAYSKLDEVKNSKAFLSYLFTIASRLNWAKLKRDSNISSLEEVDCSELSANEISADKQADLRILYSALNKLPYDQKEALILFDIMGFSQKEVCEIQNVSIDALKQRLHRGKNALKLLLRDDYSLTDCKTAAR